MIRQFLIKLVNEKKNLERFHVVNTFSKDQAKYISMGIFPEMKVVSVSEKAVSEKEFGIKGIGFNLEELYGQSLSKIAWNSRI